MAVRIALGASESAFLRFDIRDGVRQALAGVVLGALLGVLAVRLIAARLRDIQIVNPVVLLGAAGVLIVVALVAALVPALSRDEGQSGPRPQRRVTGAPSRATISFQSHADARAPSGTPCRSPG